MKAYCIKIADPSNPHDRSPFCWMDEAFNADGSDEQIQITTDKGQAYATLDSLERRARSRGTESTYQVIEFEI